MTGPVFVAEKQAHAACQLHEEVASWIKRGDTVELVLEATQAWQGPTAINSTLYMWLLRLTSTIAMTRSRFYHESRSSNNGAFTKN